jgi:hypothetical protein
MYSKGGGRGGRRASRFDRRFDRRTLPRLAAVTPTPTLPCARARRPPCKHPSVWHPIDSERLCPCKLRRNTPKTSCHCPFQRLCHLRWRCHCRCHRCCLPHRHTSTSRPHHVHSPPLPRPVRPHIPVQHHIPTGLAPACLTPGPELKSKAPRARAPPCIGPPLGGDRPRPGDPSRGRTAPHRGQASLHAKQLLLQLRLGQRQSPGFGGPRPPPPPSRDPLPGVPPPPAAWGTR